MKSNFDELRAFLISCNMPLQESCGRLLLEENSNGHLLLNGWSKPNQDSAFWFPWRLERSTDSDSLLDIAIFVLVQGHYLILMIRYLILLPERPLFVSQLLSNHRSLHCPKMGILRTAFHPIGRKYTAYLSTLFTFHFPFTFWEF